MVLQNHPDGRERQLPGLALAGNALSGAPSGSPFSFGVVYSDELVAHHEAGHCLWLFARGLPIYDVTIVPTDRYAGLVRPIAKARDFSYADEAVANATLIQSGGVNPKAAAWWMAAFNLSGLGADALYRETSIPRRTAEWHLAKESIAAGWPWYEREAQFRRCWSYVLQTLAIPLIWTGLKALAGQLLLERTMTGNRAWRVVHEAMSQFTNSQVA